MFRYISFRCLLAQASDFVVVLFEEHRGGLLVPVGKRSNFGISQN
jgi:hypothetical protein